jgi:hypothetical protein
MLLATAVHSMIFKKSGESSQSYFRGPAGKHLGDTLALIPQSSSRLVTSANASLNPKILLLLDVQAFCPSW